MVSKGTAADAPIMEKELVADEAPSKCNANSSLMQGLIAFSLLSFIPIGILIKLIKDVKKI